VNIKITAARAVIMVMNLELFMFPPCF